MNERPRILDRATTPAAASVVDIPQAASAVAAHRIVTLTVNGKPVRLRCGSDVQPWATPAYDVYPWHTLAHTLRETLGLTGTKVACNSGACGSCTVLRDGKPIMSCSTLTAACDGAEITTIESLADPVTGALHPIQQAFVDHHGVQCGFCIPGMIMSAKALLECTPEPTVEDVKHGMCGNLCRCGNYQLILKSVLEAARAMQQDARVPR